LKIVEGNPGHRPIDTSQEPEPDGDLVDCPAYLSDREKEIWQFCIENSPPGLMKRLDTSTLERYVVAKALFEEAHSKIREKGLLIKQGKTWAYNPYLAMLNKQSEILRKASDELGYSPAARTRVKIKGKKKAGSAFGKLKTLDD